MKTKNWRVDKNSHFRVDSQKSGSSFKFVKFYFENNTQWTRIVITRAIKIVIARATKINYYGRRATKINYYGPVRPK